MPWRCVVGAWRRGRFVSAEQLRQEVVELIDPTVGFVADVSEMMREQQVLWRATWLAER